MIKEWELDEFILHIEENKKTFLNKPIHDLNCDNDNTFVHYVTHKNNKYGGFMWVYIDNDEDYVYSTSELGEFKIKRQNQVILKNMHNTRVNINFGNIDVYYINCTHFVFENIEYKKYEDCVIYTYEDCIPKKKGTNLFLPIIRES